MATEEFDRTEAEAVLRTRAELGPALEIEIVEGFTERIEQLIEQRMAAERSHRAVLARRADADGIRQLVIGLVSLVSFIPLSIVLGLNDQAGALMLVLAAIVSVNVAFAWRARRS